MLFWLWVLVALGVYGYRIWRRATQGSKAQREAVDTASGDRAASGGLLSRSAPPPLPDGPVEARLPRSLQDPPSPTDRPPAADPTATSTAAGTAATGEGPSAPVEQPTPLPRATTVAEALRGIQMPEQLLPVIDPGDPVLRDGRVVRFAGTGSTVEAMTAQMADELRRLGFEIHGLETATPARAGLTATRDDATVVTTVNYDDDSTAVVVELSV